MKTKRNRKRRTITEFRETVMRNNLMQRFVHDIQREEPLDEQTLRMMLAYQPTRI